MKVHPDGYLVKLVRPRPEHGHHHSDERITMTTQTAEPTVAAVLKADPIRVRLLALVAAGTASSASEAAPMLNEPLGNVAYHLRQLRDAGLVMVTDHVPVRGTMRRELAATPAGREALERAATFFDHLADMTRTAAAA